MNQFIKKHKNRILGCLLSICLLVSNLAVWADGETLPEVGAPTGNFEVEESTEAGLPETETENVENTEAEATETEDSSNTQESTVTEPEVIVIDPQLTPVYEYLQFKEQQAAKQQIVNVVNEHKNEEQQEGSNYETELLRSMRLRKHAELSELNSIVYRSEGHVNVRKDPNAEAEIVGIMRKDATAVVLEPVYQEDGTWYHIQSGEVTGYVKAEFFVSGYAAVEIISNITQGYASIINDAQRLYRERDTSSYTLASLSSGRKYQMVSWDEEFVRILYAAGERGNIYGFVPRDSVEISWETPKAVSIEVEQRSLEESNRILYEVSKVDQSVEAARIESIRAAEESSYQAYLESSIEQSKADYQAWLEASQRAVAESIRAVEDESRRQEESIRAAEESRIAESSWIKAQQEAAAAAEASRQAAAAAAEASRQAAAAAAAAEASRQAAAESSRQAQQWQNVNDNSRFIPEGTSDLRRRIVLNALQYVGVLDYVFTGYSLVTGTDCSGFISLIYGQYGVELAHYSYHIAYTGVQVMSINQARPGDIVCWRTWNESEGRGHVAIYIGRNEYGVPMIVEAPREGLKVRVIPMPEEGLHTIRNVLGD